VGTYTGPGVTGYGSRTYWNQIIGPSSRNPDTFTNSTSLADDGATETMIGLTIVTGGGWDWTSTPKVPLLDSAVSLPIKQAAGGQLQVEWSQGKLLEATSVEGPWTTTTATSPHLVTPAGTRTFYRALIQ